jgi:hypothetical protein
MILNHPTSCIVQFMLAFTKQEAHKGSIWSWFRHSSLMALNPTMSVVHCQSRLPTCQMNLTSSGSVRATASLGGGFGRSVARVDPLQVCLRSEAPVCEHSGAFSLSRPFEELPCPSPHRLVWQLRISLYEHCICDLRLDRELR